MKTIILKDGRTFEIITECKRFYVVKKYKIGDVGIVEKRNENISSIVEQQ